MNIKSITFGFSAVLLALLLASSPADAAKRLGGGAKTGVQRDSASPSPAAAPNASQAQGTQRAAASPSAAAAPAAAAAPKRSWMGPVAGILAGTAIGALLMNTLGGAGGMGGMIGGLLMLLAFGALAFFAFRMFKNRMGGGMQPSLAGAGGSFGGNAGAPHSAPQAEAPATLRAVNTSPNAAPQPTGGATNIFGEPIGQAPTSFTPSHLAEVDATPRILPGFAIEPFEVEGKKQFIKLQAANDTGDVSTLRDFMTPALYAELAPEIMGRSGQQRVDVVRLDAKVVEVVEEHGQFIASIKFTGELREDGATAAPFVEVWHIVKPVNNGSWLLAGIQPIG